MEPLAPLLSSIDIQLDQLLIDPNNPRFAELGEELDIIPESRIAEKTVQLKAFEKMQSRRFDVNELSHDRKITFRFCGTIYAG